MTKAAARKAPIRVDLDPDDPDDRRIIARQVRAARQAGRDGRDRARTTRGRADLESAYDEGAAKAAAPEPESESEPTESESESDPAAPGRAARAGTAAGKGARASAGYLSRGRWRPTLTPPTRARDAGGLLTGMLLYTVVITYVRYGASGWKGWLAAKFLNRPMASNGGQAGQGLGAAGGGIVGGTAK